MTGQIRKSVSIQELGPIIVRTVASGGTVELTVTGNSMLPLLKDRMSAVKLAQAENLSIGDIVLFQRRDGQYVLHRICAVCDGGYDIVGDHQLVPDRNVPKEAIIAKVVAYNRVGKRWKTDAPLYRRLLPAIKTAGYYGGRIKRKLLSIARR